jgi:hypothetical protein
MKNKLGFLLFLFLFYPSFVKADFSNSLSFSGSNQLEYSLGTKDTTKIFEDWFDLLIQTENLNLGLRYEVHHPSYQDSVFQGIPYRFLEFKKEPINIIAGTYYVILGKGLILRSYEERDLRIDNNLDGAKISVDWDKFSLSLLSGAPLLYGNKRGDLVNGGEGKISLFKWCTLGAGGAIADIKNWGRFKFSGPNLNLNFPHFDFYTEYVKKKTPLNQSNLKNGYGTYLSFNFYFTGLGITGEYKDYNRFDFTYNQANYHNPPSLTKEHLYTLLNRNSHIQDDTDERGIQIQSTFSPFSGLNGLINFSRLENHQSSLLFSEAYLEMEYYYKDKGIIKGGLGRSQDKTESGEPIRWAPLLDLTYNYSSSSSFNFILEHLWTSKYKAQLSYYDQIISLGFSVASLFSFTVSTERTTQAQEKKSWTVASFDFVGSENHTLSLSYGSRREGKVCSSGMCVYKPKFEGFELKLLSRF